MRLMYLLLCIMTTFACYNKVFLANCVPAYGHRNIKTQGITTAISLLYWSRWNHYFVSLWISTLMTF